MNKYFITILIFLLHKTHSQDLYDNLEVEIKKNVNWYAGILIEGHKMPFKNGYEAQLYGTSYYNQLQPLLLSTSGELVWCEEPFRFRVTKEKILFDKAYAPLVYKKAGKSLRDAYLFASELLPSVRKNPSRAFFLGSPIQYMD